VTYKGHDLVVIRVYSDFRRSKEMLPTRKGVTVQVGMITELIEGLQEAKRKAEVFPVSESERRESFELSHT
jgi:hypothetical protein